MYLLCIMSIVEYNLAEQGDLDREGKKIKK
jgi:hypothetical protein